jgi:NAD(P)-dependent dehydrogenase (short-subunit alcohol dehydrogenase family)
LLTLADLQSSPVQALSLELGAGAAEVDVTDESSVVAAVAGAVAAHGGLDGVVSNAAITSEGLMAGSEGFPPFESYPLDAWQRTLDVNLTGTFLVAREAGRAIKDSGGGSVVLTSSVYGVVAPDHRIYEGQPFASFPGYSASKAGVVGLARWLATWWGEDGVRVNALSPGGVSSGQPQEFADRYAARTPLGRMATPQDIVGALLFLLSDASSYCTGQNLVVDGGLTAW